MSLIQNYMVAQYLERIIGRLYKILPLKEDGEDTIQEYIDGLLTELVGVDLIDCMPDQPYYMSVVAIVAYLNDNIQTCPVKKVRRNVFRAISLCKKLKIACEGGEAE